MRGAWVEIRLLMNNIRYKMSLPVRGAWVEMAGSATGAHRAGSRSPCGERGLKSFAAALVRRRPSSLPVRGAWVEMLSSAI